MRILVNQDEIAIFQRNIMSKINIIEEDIKKMRIIERDLIWNGKSSSTFKNRYEENICDIENKIETLIQYVDFLSNFCSKYSKANDSIKGEYRRIRGGKNG